MLNGLKETVFTKVTNLSQRQKVTILLFVDGAVVLVAVFAVSVLFGGILSGGPMQSEGWFAGLTVVMSATSVALSYALGLAHIKLNVYELRRIWRSVAHAVGVGFVGWIGSLLLFKGSLLFQTMVLVSMVLLILLVGVRILMRKVLVGVYRRGRLCQRVLIYGAGQTGVQLATALGHDNAMMPVGFIDDNPTLNNLTVAGLRVYSPARVENLVKDLLVDRVVLAMPSISRPKQAQIARRLTEMGCDVSVLPSFASLVDNANILQKIQPVNPADFLNRSGLDSDLAGLTGLYEGRCVMITGAGGSVGAELVRQILSCGPKRLVLYEIGEYALYQIGRELDEMGLSVEIDLVLGSVLDSAAVRCAILDKAVDVIIHAAAYKHVTLVEKNIVAGLRNNVFGTRVVAEAARDLNVRRFVLVSTDKAVNPSSVMGASKRLAELVVQDLSTRSGEGTRFSIVRFGNVLGSSGSVVPLFDEQIARGGPVSLTHKDATRYFMTLSEAARLVLLTEMFDEGGKLFVLDMGEPVRILDLAEQMIEQAGYSVRSTANPEGDIEIVSIGLSKGEKLHEELATSADRLETTTHPKILRAAEDCLSELEMASALKALGDALDAGSNEGAIEVLRRWLPLSHPVVEVLHRQPNT
ncbi:nucleoside-diphosphate sugar epimerase/dehydratase [Thalassobium sp. R2A62]|uniref:polysaccharide biosynthesis protein n=1 Tax=Thalassobium sp. R2A62 TaxID=633131 RepID=UPI0001B1D652|nr:nucleoside-diphosphate sugar epimerase/dehydratase [Thalassobium sp. R2A62]EET48630.1 polysaccharide biosynthesis protein CapD [Thalassobium sp. R2A62]